MIKQISDLTAPERTAHEATYGGFNQTPANWREVTERTVIETSLWPVYTPILTEYRQMYGPQGYVSGGTLVEATLYYFHDGSGVGMHFDHKEKRARWYQFERCAHTYVEVSRPAGHRSGIHVDRCSKCGFQNAYDTSD